MAEVWMHHLTKVFNGQKAVDKLDLHIKDGEFIVLVGPSGCGKSTTLKMVAGLEKISGGELYIDGKKVNDVPAKDRNIAMVFQNFALYPHMNVYDNIAFNLKLKKMKKEEIQKRVEYTADILGITPLFMRKPDELSGGEKQRVALGRAMVRDADVFLMDEPLSNLDAKLRTYMRTEIKKLHHRLQTTTIYVTHDQMEAMTMGDRLAVMKDGKIQQIGTPREIYEQPDNMFVAEFIGSPAMNFFKGKIVGNKLYIGDIPLSIPKSKLQLFKNTRQEEIIVGIRPEHLKASKIRNDEGVCVTVDVAEMAGAECFIHSRIADQPFIVRMDPDDSVDAGDSLYVTFPLEKAHFFDHRTRLRIKEERE